MRPQKDMVFLISSPAVAMINIDLTLYFCIIIYRHADVVISASEQDFYFGYNTIIIIIIIIIDLDNKGRNAESSVTCLHSIPGRKIHAGTRHYAVLPLSFAVKPLTLSYFRTYIYVRNPKTVATPVRIYIRTRILR